MKLKLLEYITCPRCKQKFNLEVHSGDDEIESGNLVCKKCSISYPIRNGIPRIIDSISDLQIKTTKAFGYEWKRFSKQYMEYEKQFLDWIYPLEAIFFKDKIILDAGCGTGRHVICSNKFEAKEVIGVDLSRDAVEVAYEHTKTIPNVHILQADIHALPFDAPFDFIYSIGVLHHLPEPEMGFKSLLKHLKKNGTIAVWVYGKEGNYLLPILNIVRKFTILMPFKIVMAISFVMTLLIYPITKIVYKPINELKSTKPLTKILPQYEFFSYLARFSFNQVHSIIFDQLIAPVANYYTREEFESWFKNAHLKDIVITWRNRNSWRGSANND